MAKSFNDLTTIPTISYCNSLKELKLASDELGVVAYEEAAKQGEKANLVKIHFIIKITLHFLDLICSWHMGDDRIPIFYI